MSQWLPGASGSWGSEARNHCLHEASHCTQAEAQEGQTSESIPRPWLASCTWYQNRRNKTSLSLSLGRPKCPISPRCLNTAQQLLCHRQHAARHLVHRVPLAGRRSSPEVPRPILLLPHDAAEGEVPLKGQDGGRHLLCLTQGVGRAGGTTAGELRKELREVAQWATGPLFYLRVSNFSLRTNRGQVMLT